MDRGYVGKNSMSCLYSAGSMGTMKMHQLWRARRLKAVDEATTKRHLSRASASKVLASVKYCLSFVSLFC